MTRQAKHDDPKEAILDAARALILEQGPEQLSLRAVARRSAYSPAALYEYFDGKDALIAAVADESLTWLKGMLESRGQQQAVDLLRPLAAQGVVARRTSADLSAVLATGRHAVVDDDPGAVVEGADAGLDRVAAALAAGHDVPRQVGRHEWRQ